MRNLAAMRLGENKAKRVPACNVLQYLIRSSHRCRKLFVTISDGCLYPVGDALKSVVFLLSSITVFASEVCALFVQCVILNQNQSKNDRNIDSLVYRLHVHES